MLKSYIFNKIKKKTVDVLSSSLFCPPVINQTLNVLSFQSLDHTLRTLSLKSLFLEFKMHFKVSVIKFAYIYERSSVKVMSKPFNE